MYTLADNVTLRPLRAGDACAYYTCARKNLARLEPWFYWANEEMQLSETEEYLRAVEMQAKPERDRPYAYFDGETMIGSIGLYSIDFFNRISRIGYWIDEDHEGKGLITAGARVLIDHAFDDLHLNRIEIRCAPDNTASRAVPHRLGFTEEGLHRQVLAIHGGFQDLIMYALLKGDRLAARRRLLRESHR
jgi:ribosomal-protein-serine acetyltransferase